MEIKRKGKRNEAGNRLVKGTESMNPNGNNGHKVGWQPYGIRLQKWLDKPPAEVMQLISDDAAFGKLSSIDAVCVRHVAGMLAGGDVRQERKDGLDRIEGVPKQSIEHTGKLILEGSPAQRRKIENEKAGNLLTKLDSAG